MEYVIAALPSQASSLPPVNCPADIVFVVDESSSIGSANFARVKSFLSQVVSRLDIDSGKTRVGLVGFCSIVGAVINLNAHSSVASLQSAISSLRYTGGSTDTAAAFAYVRTRMLTSAAGDRPTVHNIVVLVTDGRSNNFNATVVSIAFIVLFITRYSSVITCHYYPSSTICIFLIANHQTLFLICTNLWCQLLSSFRQPYYLFTLLLVHLILHTSPHRAPSLRSHHLSTPQPFIPDLKSIYSTNPFLHSRPKLTWRILDADRT